MEAIAQSRCDFVIRMAVFGYLTGVLADSPRKYEIKNDCMTLITHSEYHGEIAQSRDTTNGSPLDCQTEVEPMDKWNQFNIQFISFQEMSPGACVFLRQRLKFHDDNEPITGLKPEFCANDTTPELQKTYSTEAGQKLVVRYVSNGNGSIKFSLMYNVFRTGPCSTSFQCNNGRCIPEAIACESYRPCGDVITCRNVSRLTEIPKVVKQLKLLEVAGVITGAVASLVLCACCLRCACSLCKRWIQGASGSSERDSLSVRGQELREDLANRAGTEHRSSSPPRLQSSNQSADRSTRDNYISDPPSYDVIGDAIPITNGRSVANENGYISANGSVAPPRPRRSCYSVADGELPSRRPSCLHINLPPENVHERDSPVYWLDAHPTSVPGCNIYSIAMTHTNGSRSRSVAERSRSGSAGHFECAFNNSPRTNDSYPGSLGNSPSGNNFNAVRSTESSPPPSYQEVMAREDLYHVTRSADDISNVCIRTDER